MSYYKYGTLLKVQNDDPHPNNNVSKGDLHIKAGKHEDGDQYEVLTEDKVAIVEQKAVAIYESDERLTEKEMEKFVREHAIDDPEVDI